MVLCVWFMNFFAPLVALGDKWLVLISVTVPKQPLYFSFPCVSAPLREMVPDFPLIAVASAPKCDGLLCGLCGFARDELLASKQDGFAFEELDGCGDEDGAR